MKKLILFVLFGVALSARAVGDAAAPQDFNLHLNRAQGLFDREDGEGAWAEVRAATVADPSRYEAKALEALLQLKGGRPAEARRALNQAQALAPKEKQPNLRTISNYITRADPASSGQSGTRAQEDGPLGLLRGIVEAAEKEDASGRQAGMAAFLRESGGYAREHPKNLQVWLLRAAAAQEVHGGEDEREAGRNIMAIVTGVTPTEKTPVVGEAFTVAEIGLEMRPIPAGTFLMGSPLVEPNRNAVEIPHQVTLTRPFWLGRTLVTQGQWKALMGTDVVAQDLKAHPNAVPMYPHGNVQDDQPMYFVSWHEAMAFCQMLTERAKSEGVLPEGYEFTLPTEAQWEYACRAGTVGPTYIGAIPVFGRLDAPGLKPIAWYGGNSSVGYQGVGFDTAAWPEKEFPGGLAGPHPVALKRPNPWGLYDMIGNVFEWCRDWSGPYPAGRVTDPSGPASGTLRAARGGSWNLDASFCRAAYRDQCAPGLRYEDLGFRVALTSAP